jgi:hypothetical protein
VSLSVAGRGHPTATGYLLALLFCVISFWFQPGAWAQSATPTASAAPTGGSFYVEFRVGQIGTYGHSYAVYGMVGGKPNYADLHPVGGYAVMALGHLVPVPANTRWDPGVLALPVMSRYRKTLTGEQYRKLLAAVQSAKANKAPYWNAMTNNCNHFIGQLASAIGLRVPGEFQVSYSFVPALKALNEGTGQTTDRAVQKRRAQPPPQS